MCRNVLPAILAILLVGCSQAEDGLIYNKAPFFDQSYNLPADKFSRIVAEAREFGAGRGLKVMVSAKHFHEGEFVVTLIRPGLNISATNVASGNRLWVTAIARDEPTADDKKLLRDYLARLRNNSA
jgi:hypothetical protein